MSSYRRERSVGGMSDGDASDAASMVSVTSRSRRPSVTSHGSRIGVVRSTSVSIAQKESPENENEDEDEVPEETNFFRMSREKRLTVINFCLTNFCVGAFYSLLGPFFPNEAKDKGVSTTITGLIFGSFELVLFIFAPIFGSLIGRHVDGKFMYVTGVMSCGCTAIMFGFLDRCPPGTIYIVMCFLVRTCEAISAAAFSTASFAILAFTFPKNVATMFGSLELFSGLGLMVGPPIGGALYTLGGFQLPFISLGSLLVLVAFVSIFILPAPAPTNDEKKGGGSVFSVLCIPINIIVCLLLMSGAICIGFIDVALSLYLTQEFKLSPLITGVVFLVGPGVYALTAPIWGYVGDKWPQASKYIMIVGYVVGGTGFMLMGPAPFLGIDNSILWLLLVGLGMMGFGIGTLVLGFQVMTEATMESGMTDSLETFGLISGVFNSFFSLGAFIGPLGGGFLLEVVEFDWATFIIGAICWLVALILAIYTLTYSLFGKKTASNIRNDGSIPEERQPLLTGSDSNDFYSR